MAPQASTKGGIKWHLPHSTFEASGLEHKLEFEFLKK